MYIMIFSSNVLLSSDALLSSNDYCSRYLVGFLIILLDLLTNFSGASRNLTLFFSCEVGLFGV